MASSRPPYQRSDRTIRVRQLAKEIAEDWTEEAPTNPIIILDRHSMTKTKSDPPSTPAPAKNVIAVIGAVKSWQQVVALALILAFLLVGGKALGWF